MNAKKRISALVSAVLGAGLLFGVAAPTADAALTLYARTEYRAPMPGSYSTPTTQNFSAAWDDTLASFKNQTPYGATFYHDRNLTGHSFPANPWQNAAKFYLWDEGHASSFKLG